MTKLENHPAADMFPMMPSERLAQLVADIERNGLRNPIVLLDGKILDGRNRYTACKHARAEPRFEEFAGGDPYAFVRSLNGIRRDLDPGQRTAIMYRLDQASEEWQDAQKRRAGDANAKRSKAVEHRPRKADGTLASSAVSQNTALDEAASKPQRARDQLAERAGVSSSTAAKVQLLAAKAPGALAQVAAGEVKLEQAVRAVKRADLADRVTALPEGKYRVIYADPPWKYGDSREGLGETNYGDRGAYGGGAADHTAAAGQYPPMHIADICALDVRALAADDAVLFLWATCPLLPEALQVVKAWGFTYKTLYVWDKRRRNLGHYHNASAEMLIVATRGTGAPDITKGLPDQVQAITRGEHSGKPAEFRAMIDRLYITGPRVELFHRGAPAEGWKAWGNEVTA